jgi:hypothetical protein
VMNHYRDKGYGMGYRTGFIAGLRGEQKQILSVGVTFRENDRNASLWRRWKKLIYVDMWGVFFIGAMIGMFLPIILMRHLVLLSGEAPTEDNISTFAATILNQQYGRWLFYIALFVGFLILFDTQIGIFEALVRNMTDSLGISTRFQRFVAGDPRKFYYPFMIVLLIAIGFVLQFFQPARLILISANMSNFADLPVCAHVPELEASQGGETEPVGLPGAGAELPVLRVLLPELRVEGVHGNSPHHVLNRDHGEGPAALGGRPFLLEPVPLVSTSSTWTCRGPWTPRTRTISISAVREGPLTRTAEEASIR